MADATGPPGRGRGDTLRRLVSLMSLSQTRALLRTRRAKGWAFDVALLYAILSMLLGGMLDVSTAHQSFAAQVLYSGSPWWDYPWVFVIVPGLFLTLPFLPAVGMALVSAGVGLGGTSALLLLLPRIRLPDGTEAQPSPGTTAAVAPAITGLATMGACCCTTCASAAGVAVVAAASGTDLATLLREDWYISLFQVMVVGLCLLVTERALRTSNQTCPVPPPKDRRFVLGSMLRVALLVAGITWSLAMFVEWGNVSPTSADAAIWYHWIVEHQILSLAAVAAGLFPRELATWMARGIHRGRSWPLRIALLVGGYPWGVGVPPALVNLGLGGFLNELLGVLGAPAAWGALPPDSALGPALYFHWGFQHLLLGVFAIALALVPQRTIAPLLWSVEGATPPPLSFERHEST
ncbi:MAG TPA: hypothetical protein VEY12_08270 [Thermoplasmata archaeon]|nr:hypothetical protein [Thermoplasmata archaeon]